MAGAIGIAILIFVVGIFALSFAFEDVPTTDNKKVALTNDQKYNGIGCISLLVALAAFLIIWGWS